MDGIVKLTQKEGTCIPDITVTSDGYEHVTSCLADYFLVYSLRTSRSAVQHLYRKLRTAQYEPSAAELPGTKSLRVDEKYRKDLRMHVTDRWPKKDFKTCEVTDGWGWLAFPDGITFSTSQRLPRKHTATITLSDSTRLYASFLIYDVLLEEEEGDKAATLKRATTIQVNGSHSRTTSWKPYTTVYAPKAICLVSHYPQFELFESCLAQIYLTALRNQKTTERIPVESYLVQLMREVPPPTSEAADTCFYMASPCSPSNTSRLLEEKTSEHKLPLFLQMPTGPSRTGLPSNDLWPKIEANLVNRLVVAPMTLQSHSVKSCFMSDIPLRHLFQTLSIETILHIVSCMFYEKRILLHSVSHSKLSMVAHSLLQLFHPFKWPYPFIPVLPTVMLDAYQDTRPYIMGVSTANIYSLDQLESVVMVDIDHNCIRCTSELPQLPSQGTRLWQSLRVTVERDAIESDTVALLKTAGSGYEDYMRNLFDREVEESFLRFYAEICHGFREYVVFIDEEPYFNQEGFLSEFGDDVSSLPFVNQLIQSAFFYIFLTEEIDQSLFHDYIATGDSQLLKKICFGASSKPPVTLPVPEAPACFLPRQPALAADPFELPLRAEYMNPRDLSDFKQLQPSLSRLQSGDMSPRRATPKGLISSKSSPSQRVEHYLSRVFNFSLSHEKRILDSTALADLNKCFTDSAARQRAIEIFNQPSKQSGLQPNMCLPSDSLLTLVEICKLLLNATLTSEDWKVGTVVLSACSRFYARMSVGDDQVSNPSMSVTSFPSLDGSLDDLKSSGTTLRPCYLQSFLQDHPLWKHLAFWNNALDHCVREWESKHSADNNAEQPDSGRYDFIVGWLVTSAQFMMDSEVPMNQVRNVVEHCCKVFKIPKKEVRTLRVLLANLEQALSVMKDSTNLNND